MKNLKLKTEIRNTEEKNKFLRKEKILPWVVYGKNQKSTPIKMDYSDFLKLYRKSWESNIIDLTIWKDTIEVLVHKIQKEPVSGDFTHIDFFALTRWVKLTTKIQINFTWESQAVKEWAILDESLKEIEVKCLPKDLINSFEVDLRKLKNIWDSIRVSELIVDTEKFEILSNLNDILVSATAPAKIEEIEEEIIEWEKDEEIKWDEEKIEENSKEKSE